MSDTHDFFGERYLWPWLGPSGSIAMLCTSGCMDDVIFAVAHNGPYGAHRSITLQRMTSLRRCAQAV